MAEKSAKKKSKKAAETGVMGSLPATRAPRIGADRRGAAASRRRTTATAATAATPKPKAKAATRKKTSAPKEADAKAAKLRKPEPAPPAGWQTPGEGDRGNGAVSTAVQAAGELAQLGVTIGGQLLKRAAGRIPRR